MSDLIIPNYTVYKKIGEGGMGTVYLAEHTMLKRKSAIKILNPELADNSEIKERFHNEAITLSKLSHPNIVSLYDFIEYEGKLILIMEFAEGEPLDEILKRDRRIEPVEKCIKIFSKILNGFSYAHRQGIVHRDIKPSNIMLTDDDGLKILDFGIAKIMQSNNRVTKTGTRMGSIYYMSPEQVLGKDVDYRSDIYSLGVTLFEMLTGKLPFGDLNSEYEIQTKIVQEPLPDILSLNLNVPPYIRNIISKATAKNPEERYTCCEDFHSDLNSIHPDSSSKTVISSPRFDKTVISNTQRQKKNNLKWIISSVAVFAIAIIILLLISVNNEAGNDNKEIKSTVNKTNNADDKNGLSQGNNVSSSTDEKPAMKSLLYDWIDAQNRREYNLEKYYANTVYFYTKTVSRNYVMSQKKSFFDTYQSVNLSIENLDIQKSDIDEYTCLFDKPYNATSYSGKINEGKVRSRIIFKKFDSDWKIIRESDDKIYGYYKTK